MQQLHQALPSALRHRAFLLPTQLPLLEPEPDMSNLWYYIHGKLNISYVSVSPEETIVELKKKIYLRGMYRSGSHSHQSALYHDLYGH